VCRWRRRNARFAEVRARRQRPVFRYRGD